MEAAGAALYSHEQVEGTNSPSLEAVSTSKDLRGLQRASRCCLCGGFAVRCCPRVNAASRGVGAAWSSALGPTARGLTAVGGMAQNRASGCRPCCSPWAPMALLCPHGRGLLDLWARSPSSVGGMEEGGLPKDLISPPPPRKTFRAVEL
ncbi:hypothetical protein NDU88_006664 [Pleurodeles waltl]|uniref:Uncharacterized protein n=1 Tax=Pleurodeles waltl TaxID=8319 RepID=A0AAV7U136_PLEWA|nr:hypothetical protein NDU88_006664 [Pleurodeles waltl]